MCDFMCVYICMCELIQVWAHGDPLCRPAAVAERSDRGHHPSRNRIREGRKDGFQQLKFF